jgi:peptidoglycan/xylan/chitin deacetylase (PgdA/CDA1 family)
MPGALSLTFDDGPDEVWTRRVLEALARASVRATFFMVGERVRRAPATARAVLEAGHEVQLHCDRHLAHSELGERELERDASSALASLELLGAHPTYWRAPWGVQTAASEQVARAHRLTLVRWTVDTHDWRGDSPARMLVAARRSLAQGGVVLMHDALGPGATRDGCANTVDFIAALVAAARSRGVRVGPLSLQRPRAPRPSRSNGHARGFFDLPGVSVA